MIRYKYFIQGIVQGVGFRPFIYKLATELQLNGYVLNNTKGVELELEGDVKNIEIFDERFLDELPPLAHVDNFEKHPVKLQNTIGFEIIQTLQNDTKTALVSPDIKICEECIEDIETKEKYLDYFATNCTNCGPRYSIIKTIPYDRNNTSMETFVMCSSCQKEYTNPLNRRYHAQPISCNSCGPTLSLYDNGSVFKTDNIYESVSKLIKKGEILAIKGVGGFHIVCDATNDKALIQLREHKKRPQKPFALMCKNIQQINSFAYIQVKEKQLLTSKEAPIVVLDKKQTKKISDLVAPKIKKIGCFLPTTALHHLLFKYLDAPIVATSANLSGEPIITSKKQIQKKLPFIKYILDFNREIINAIDDSLVQVINNQTSMLRLARGYAPKVLKLPFKTDKKILAVGANSKSTISITFEDKLIISPYIGDTNSIVSFEYFMRTIETFKRFYDFEPDMIVHDLHPNYETTKWAKNQNKPLIALQHHLAHIYALKAEYNLQDTPYLGFSFDGTGYGEDKTLWGGEVFINDKREYSFKPIKLLGGTQAIKEPRRVALAMLFEYFDLEQLSKKEFPTLKAFTDSELKLLYQSYEKNINAPQTSSVGRLFDALCSFGDILQTLSYEGESGLLVESFYSKEITDTFKYTIIDKQIDIKIIDHLILNPRSSKEELSSMLINTLSRIILDISQTQNLPVLLTGGVFQNKTLLEKVTKGLESIEAKHYFHLSVPSNDSGISVGQIYKALLDIQ